MASPADPFGIYIHWPYCEAKCPYCDFNSYAKRSIAEEAFLEAALCELRGYFVDMPDRTVTSIFFGGGTPSLMSPRTVGALLDAIAESWQVSPDCEITLEANPSSVEAERFAAYRACGVNRISLGVQSLDDAQLRFLGRLHNAAVARAALGIAAKNFDRVSFDLIYARPGQTLNDWRSELSEALKLSRGHLSLYQLTIEQGTAFFDLERRGKLLVPPADDVAALYELTQELCEVAGLPAYEVSNHAAKGEESRHNLTYWRYDDYIGIGPGAHGRYRRGGRKVARATLRDPAAWRTRALAHGYGGSEETELTPREEAEEMLLMGLRLNEGVRLAALKSATGYMLDTARVSELEAHGFLEVERDAIRVAPSHKLVLNAILGELVPSLREDLENRR